ADFKGASDNSELKKLMEYNENRTESTPEELNKDNIDELSISEIEKKKNEELDKIEDEAGDILNSAFNDLKEGEIDRETYLNVLNGLKSFDRDAKEGNEEMEVSPELLDYMIKDEFDISDDPVDNILKNTRAGISFAGLFKAYELYSEGFKIRRIETKSGKIQYRVYNPEVAGIKTSRKSSKRKYNQKIYDKSYIKSQTKRWKFGSHLKIAKHLDLKAGAASGVKTKAGWLGVAIDAGLNVKENIQDGESKQRIIGDAGVDVGIGAISLVAAGAVSAAVVGTFGAPVLAGAAVGFAATSAVSAAINWKFGASDKSITDRTKDGVQSAVNGVKSGVKTVAGWFK